MNMLDVYSALQKREITLEEAASAFNFTVTDMKFRLTKWGHRLPLLLATLDKIRENELSRGEAAATLSVTPRQINQLMKTWSIVRPIPDYVVRNTLTEIKWEIRKKYAIEFIAGSCTLEEASDNAEVSTRQMRRWVAELLHKHFGMVFKDLKELTESKKKRVADEIEASEGLEYAKQSVIRAISRGESTMMEEAAARLSTNRRYNDVRRVTEAKPRGRRGPKVHLVRDAGA